MDKNRFGNFIYNLRKERKLTQKELADILNVTDKAVSRWETGKRILELRQTKGWTQKQLAERLNVTDKAVSKWERGINYPDLSLLEPIAREFDVTVADLLGLEDSPESNKVLEETTKICKNEIEELKTEFRHRVIGSMVLALLIVICSIILGATSCDHGWPNMAVCLITNMGALTFANCFWIQKKYKKII